MGDGYRRIDGVLDLIASVEFDMERFAGLQRNESRLISLAMNSRFFLVEFWSLPELPPEVYSTLIHCIFVPQLQKFT